MAKKTRKPKEESPTPDALPVSESSIKRVEPDEFYKAKFIRCVVQEGKYGPYTGLDLQAVQIVDLVPYKNGDGDEFFSDGEEF